MSVIEILSTAAASVELASTSLDTIISAVEKIIEVIGAASIFASRIPATNPFAIWLHKLAFNHGYAANKDSS